jgi:heat shock protein HtpX
VRRCVNGVKTALLLGALSGVMLLIGSYFGQAGLVVALLLALAVNGYAYFCSDRIALRAVRARPVGPAELPVLHRVVEELSAAAGQPRPRLYVSPLPVPNAFATGRSPRHAAVCVTVGLLRILDERELRAVLGHELAHVHHRDILISSVAGALAGAIGFLAEMASWAGLLGAAPDGAASDEEERNPVQALLIALLAPLAAVIVQLAVSRTREYEADAGGAELTGDPLALASALRKLELAALRPEPLLASQAHLMIANPFRAGSGLAALFATHPPIADRVRRLEQMVGPYRMIGRHGPVPLVVPGRSGERPSVRPLGGRRSISGLPGKPLNVPACLPIHGRR